MTKMYPCEIVFSSLFFVYQVKLNIDTSYCLYHMTIFIAFSEIIFHLDHVEKNKMIYRNLKILP